MNEVHPICIYSTFGLGKTSIISELVKVLLPKLGTDVKARLYSAEHWNSVKDTVRAGLIEPWKVNTRDFPFETLHFAADNYWPTDPSDPTSSFMAPTKETYVRYPIRIYEGLATFANYLSGNYVAGAMADRIGRGESIGPTDSGELIRITDGSAVVGGLSRSNYGFVQKEMTSIVQRSQKRHGFVFWTTHEDDVVPKKGKDAGIPLLGPEVFGGALTNVIGREFADVWRIVGIPTDYQTKTGVQRVIERRLYFKEHIDPASGMMAKCRNSAGLERQNSLPDYIRLTDLDRPGLPREGVAEKIVELIGL